jgi:hypothetical protein
MSVRGRTAAAILAAGPLLLPTTEATALTIQEYLDRAKSGADSPDAAWLSSYMAGLRDALYDFNSVMQISGVYVFCPPVDQDRLPTAEFRQRLEAAVEEYRNQQAKFDEFAAETPLGVIGVQVLSEMYVCEQDEGEETLPEAPTVRP